MRLNHLRLAAFALVLCAACASAETALAPPQFTAEEMQTINRNETLKQVFADDPALIRRVLDDIARDRGTAFAPPDGLDPLKNPDLRSSPEAAYDLFQLLKRAAAGKPGAAGK